MRLLSVKQAIKKSRANNTDKHQQANMILGK